MIYRMQILAESGLYEGWAHTHEEMKAKFQAEYPEECFTFLYGDAPKNLEYDHYQKAKALGLDDRTIALLDYICGELNSDIEAAYDPYQGEV